MEFVVKFDVDNDAFGEWGSPAFQLEVSRILGKIAEKALFISNDVGTVVIHDSNGNRVGEWGWQQ